MEAQYRLDIVRRAFKYNIRIQLIDVDQLHQHRKNLQNIHLVLAERQARLFQTLKKPADLLLCLFHVIALYGIHQKPLILLFQLQPGSSVFWLHILNVCRKPSFFSEQGAVFQRILRFFKRIF